MIYNAECSINEADCKYYGEFKGVKSMNSLRREVERCILESQFYHISHVHYIVFVLGAEDKAVTKTEFLLPCRLKFLTRY